MTDIDKTIEEAKACVLPYECWYQLPKESSLAYSAFCVFRDLEADRTIINAFEVSQKDTEQNKQKKSSYKQWCNWSMQWQWKERVAAYDRHIEQLKQTELRKTIEAQAEKHREVTGKMLDVASRKLTTMNPEDLTQGGVTEFVTTAIKLQREIAGLTSANTEMKQGEFSFEPEFKGL